MTRWSAAGRMDAIAFDAEDSLVACATTSATVVRTLTLRPTVTRAAASGLLLATEVADYLVGRGLPFRTAHEVSGRIARDLYERGRDYSALSMDDWQRYHPLFEPSIVNAITPEAAVSARLTPQSTNPAAVQASLDRVKIWMRARDKSRSDL